MRPGAGRRLPARGVRAAEGLAGDAHPPARAAVPGGRTLPPGHRGSAVTETIPVLPERKVRGAVRRVLEFRLWLCRDSSWTPACPLCPVLRFARTLSRAVPPAPDRKSTRLNSSHITISYAVFCLKKKKPKSNLLLLNKSIYAHPLD